MHESSLPNRPTLTRRFHGAGRSGTVRAYYGVTMRPSESGFRFLAGWAGIPTAGVGFPTIKCEVESDRPGYGSALGWVQWVTQEFGDGRASVTLVDRPPSLLDRDLPFLSFGYAPTVFDAPAFNSLPEVDWCARLFLCTAPMLSREETIRPLFGVVWGYRIAAEGRRPTPYPLVGATRADWSEARRALTAGHPEWKFAAAFPAAPGTRSAARPRSA